MISGYFSQVHPGTGQFTHPAVPLLNVALWIPALGNIDSPDAAIAVTFLVDTGADMTTLHPQDSRRLFKTTEQWAWVRRQPSTNMGGAGHGMPHYHVDAFLLLIHDDGKVDPHRFPLYVPEPHAGNEQLESLLGRDILQNYVATFDQLHRLSLETPPPAPVRNIPGLP